MEIINLISLKNYSGTIFWCEFFLKGQDCISNVAQSRSLWYSSDENIRLEIGPVESAFKSSLLFIEFSFPIFRQIYWLPHNIR